MKKKRAAKGATWGRMNFIVLKIELINGIVLINLKTLNTSSSLKNTYTSSFKFLNRYTVGINEEPKINNSNTFYLLLKNIMRSTKTRRNISNK